MKKQGWREAILDGWKLASVTEANGQSQEIKRKFKNDLKIYLSDGYWDRDRQCALADPSPKLDVLIIPKPAMLKIFEKPIKDIPFGWRLACMSEAAANLDTVKEILQRPKIRYANLCDGNVNENGIIEGTSAATGYYLFIQIAEEAK